jgi:predicted nucleic acid-binding protein
LTTFLDTSAILALFDADDPRHPEVDSVWKEIILSEEPLVSSNYILVETLALVQRRLGMDAVQAVQRDIVPLLEIEWLTDDIHQAAMAAFLRASRRKLSFVDCSSFEVMRRRGIVRALAVDGHFGEHGFEQVPG